MKIISITVLGLMGALSTYASPSVTSGSTVSLNGTYFTDPGGWSTGVNGTGPGLVNGVFQPEQQQWDFNSVWWNGTDFPNNNIVINLNGTFAIDGFTVQADDNDVYEIDYLAPGSAVWQTAWTIPSPGGFGLTTSSNTLATAIDATALRFEAVGGDGLYAVSQIVATGQAVPDTTTTLPLLSAGLGGLVVVRRFFRR
jgi:hypothetical protein